MNTEKNHPFAGRLRFAAAGLRQGFASERSLRTQAVALLGLLGVLGWLRAPAVWWALTLLSAGFVLSAELLNTALERLADRVHPERHPEIRIAKDCAAAAVLVAAITSVAVFCALLIAVLLHA